ncbi:class I SAM-dependent methyltransferase [Chloroflexota bacterium]
MTVFSDYDPFAYVYNMHWGNNLIPLVFPMLEKYILNGLPEKANILDLCCGTGQLALLLTNRNYQVTGIDGSENMLKFARQNAPEANFVQADARSFEQADKFHAVLSTFDSLNHVLKIEELTDVFRNVHQALRKNGVFFFDMNMDAGFKSNWDDNVDIVKEDNVCIFRTDYNPEEQMARFYATIFILDNGWQRTDVTLVQKCYPEKEILSALSEAGFMRASSYAADIGSGLTELTADSERAFFICRKS